MDVDCRLRTVYVLHTLYGTVACTQRLYGTVPPYLRFFWRTQILRFFRHICMYLITSLQKSVVMRHALIKLLQLIVVRCENWTEFSR
jgi:hypothetical protein